MDVPFLIRLCFDSAPRASRLYGLLTFFLNGRLASTVWPLLCEKCTTLKRFAHFFVGSKLFNGIFCTPLMHFAYFYVVLFWNLHHSQAICSLLCWAESVPRHFLHPSHAFCSLLCFASLKYAPLWSDLPMVCVDVYVKCACRLWLLLTIIWKP